MLFGDFGKPFLSLMKLPAGRQVTAVFRTVRVADHDHLLTPAQSGEVSLIYRDAEQFLKNCWGVAEIIDRFEQRNNRQCGQMLFVGMMLSPDSSPQPQDGQHVGRGVCHTDDVTADSMSPVRFVLFCEQQERIEDFARLRRELFNIDTSWCHSLCDDLRRFCVHKRSVFMGLQCDDFFEAAAVHFGVLPNVQRREVETKCVGQINPRLQILLDDPATAIGQHAVAQKRQIGLEFSGGLEAAVTVRSRSDRQEASFQPEFQHANEAPIRLQLRHGAESSFEVRPSVAAFADAIAQAVV